MGIAHYTLVADKVSKTTDLAQPCKLQIEIGESVFQHLAMARILRGFHLLPDAAAAELQGLSGLARRDLFQCKSLF